MKKTIGYALAAILALALLIVLPTAAFADAEGSCGENVTYYYDSTNKVLTLSGSGATNDYTGSGNGRSPFYQNATIRNNCTSIVVEEGITAIGNYLFFYLNQVESVTLPSTVTEIRNYAFASCFKAASLEIPSGVTVIGESAFTGCRVLPSVTIPAGVETLPKQCFYNCWALTSLTIPGTVKTIGQSAFGGCTALSELVIEEGVETIGMTAFSSSALTGVTIPASVTSFSYDAFSGCSQLAAITVAEGNTVISDVGGVVYNNDRSVLIVCPAGYTGNYEIDPSCVTISDQAFMSCASLTGVTIPASVTTIGLSAFQSAGLETVTVPETVTEMGTGVFQSSSLVSATVNAAVDTLPDYTFNGCPNLEAVVLGPSIQTFGSSVFAYSPLLASVTVPEGLTSIPDYCFNGCAALTEITIPEGVTSIGSYAFGDCTGLVSIELPDGLEIISNGAFQHCTLITDMTIPAGVTRIEGSIFNRCSALEEVVVLAGEVTFVGGNAFANCPVLTSVTFNCPPIDQQAIGWGPFTNSPEVEIHYPNAYPDWSRAKPFDKNNYVGVYVEDDVAAKVEFVRTELRARPEEDEKRDLRFVFRLTPKEGVAVTRRYVDFSIAETGESVRLNSYKNFAGDTDGSVIFTAVLSNMDESMFGYHVSAQAFLVMDGAWTGTGYCMPETTTVDDLLNAD